ncbi:helix-turn-helix domain-containing protein [Acetatifactor muris]|uniref:Anaerobic benzoate catabolism transcriptional regulator n=1 Tax=Acetatifactor muris TaxID=879566 RepID=A0A2K4ZQX7_9FIRM|nr:helix-turn-helix transcriptional regulator [Acetatifactor muris]MCR2051200.1 helix-turn-helix domain-containing protein [Acetatifactor muris]SOY32866.1 anaerobic benzoate catabolism transcriptional regulator [Acetatifactor muris]
MTTGKKIKHFRNLRSISQKTLGQLSGINSATIKKYEYGIRNPKPDQLLKIANALGISINVFMDFDIETVSDVLSLILKMDEQLDMNFEAESTRTEVSIPLQSKYPLKTLCSIINWAYT